MIPNKTILTVLLILMISVTLGCEKNVEKQLDEREKLLEQNKELSGRIERLEQQNQALSRQIKTISGLDESTRLELLSRLERIEILKRTGLYDRDDDGIREKLIVYVRTYDQQGDNIKVAISADVQLWDLSQPQSQALLKEWSLDTEQTRQMWAGTMMTNYYRLVFDVGDVLDEQFGDLTVKVKFTDYVTGDVYTHQYVIKNSGRL